MRNFWRSGTRRVGAGWLTVLLLVSAGALASSGDWLRLAEDGIHDPENPALQVLQQPSDAMSGLPRDAVGNLVRWVKALDEGYIQPRASIESDTEVRTLDLDIIMRSTGDAPWVVFPHRPHTEWLDCTNCHDKIFAAKAGATPVTMLAILSGEYCGRCHGAVSFPLTECARCHSMSVGSEIPAGAKSE